MLGVTRIFDGDKLYSISPDDEEVTISSQDPEDETTITPNKMLYFYEDGYYFEMDKVKYVGDSSPDPLIIDYSIIRTAPKTLNIAGVGDLLSIHTASFDWEHADNNGLSEFPFSQDAVIAGQKIIDGLYNSIGEIKKGTNSSSFFKRVCTRLIYFALYTKCKTVSIIYIFIDKYFIVW